MHQEKKIAVKICEDFKLLIEFFVGKRRKDVNFTEFKISI